jgi:L-asparaginase II
MHVEAVRAWLARLGLGDGDLECGAHYPSHEPSMRALVAAGETPQNAHNNCSGKHTAMLATARHMDEPTRGYSKIGHPVQQRVIATIAEMSGCDLSDAPVGIDGCSLPNVALPLRGLARAMARFAAPETLEPARAEACRRLAAGIAAHPLMIAGHGRACSAIIAALKGRVTVKTGAEGVFVAAVHEKGLGVALKVADGASRASEVAVIAVLRHLGVVDDATWQGLAEFAAPVLRNRRDLAVGTIRPAAEGAF